MQRGLICSIFSSYSLRYGLSEIFNYRLGNWLQMLIQVLILNRPGFHWSVRKRGESGCHPHRFSENIEAMTMKRSGYVVRPDPFPLRSPT